MSESDVFGMVADNIRSPEETGLITTIGAGARDLHLTGTTWPGYRPGEKTNFTSEDYERLKLLKESEYEVHLGGNMLNAVTALSAWGHETRFCGVLSHPEDSDPTSNLIRKHLAAYGISDFTRERHGYQVSSSVIMYGDDDRHALGIPRGSMQEALDVDHLRGAMRDAKTVAFASLKDWILNRRVLGLTTELPESTFVSVNFGSSEFRDPNHKLVDTLEIRRPDLLALNETEIRQLYCSNESPETLTAEASKKDARFVLTTCGKDGVLLGHNGDVQHAPALLLDPGTRIYTLGAGDRAHALALSGLIRNMAPEKIPELVALGTVPVLQTIGAHGDLKPLQR